VDDAGVVQCPIEGVRAIARAVVSQDPLDRHVVRFEELLRSAPELDRGVALFVGVDLAVGQSSVRVDRGVHERISQSGSPGVAVAQPSGVAIYAPAATARDPAQLLDVDVDELARITRLDTANDPPSHAVHPRQPVLVVADQHSMHSRGVHSENAAQAGWAELARLAQRDDPPFHTSWGLMRARVRPARAIN
jgi:hypothetical protein